MPVITAAASKGLRRYINYEAFITATGISACYYLEHITGRVHLGYSLSILANYLFLNS